MYTIYIYTYIIIYMYMCILYMIHVQARHCCRVGQEQRVGQKQAGRVFTCRYRKDKRKLVLTGVGSL